MELPEKHTGRNEDELKDVLQSAAMGLASVGTMLLVYWLESHLKDSNRDKR